MSQMCMLAAGASPASTRMRIITFHQAVMWFLYQGSEARWISIAICVDCLSIGNYSVFMKL